jgi:hypothetical protein
MRLAAQYMRGEEIDLAPLLSKPEGERKLLIQGALSTLLRNITLPRDGDDQQEADRAMQGMLQVGRDPHLQAVLEEMKKILGQFTQHKEQLRNQIEEQFAQQTGSTEQSKGQIQREPSHHPQFAEEWQKVMVQLNEKYGNALDQHKAHIQQLVTS